MNGWTGRDEVSLFPLYFNSLVAIFSLVRSLFVFLPLQPNHPPRFPRRIRYTLSLSFCPSLLFLHLCVSSVGPLPPFIDNSASHLVLLSHSSIPRFYFFCRFSFSFSFLLSIAFLSDSTVFAFVWRSFRVPHILLVWGRISFFLPVLLSLSSNRLWRIATSLLLRSVLPLTFQRYSRRLLLFLPSAVKCRGCGRKRDGG